MNWNKALVPSLHHRKEGWPSDQENIAKHPLIARPGWFSFCSYRKTTPAVSVSVASRNFFDDTATPPCGDARRGLALYSCSHVHRPPLQVQSGLRIVDPGQH